LADPAKTRAVVVGSGPNGLSAAIVLARAGYDVTVYEGGATIGGGARSAELTLPGFVHDVCSAVHPLAACSPCFEQWPLAAHGLEWVEPDAPLAHPLDDGSAIVLERSLDATAAGVGHDGAAWRSLFAPLVDAWPGLRHDVLAPLGIPRHPLSWRDSDCLRFVPRDRWPKRIFAENARVPCSPALRLIPLWRWKLP
jgi:phytoene dehydrogenase-like protein